MIWAGLHNKVGVSNIGVFGCRIHQYYLFYFDNYAIGPWLVVGFARNSESEMDMLANAKFYIHLVLFVILFPD